MVGTLATANDQPQARVDRSKATERSGAEEGVGVNKRGSCECLGGRGVLTVERWYTIAGLAGVSD